MPENSMALFQFLHFIAENMHLAKFWIDWKKTEGGQQIPDMLTTVSFNVINMCVGLY